MKQTYEIPELKVIGITDEVISTSSNFGNWFGGDQAEEIILNQK